MRTAAAGELGSARGGRRPVTRALLAVLLAPVIALGLSTGPAQAHAELLSTTPEEGAVLDEAPEGVELRFNEPVRVVDGATRLFPSDGDSTVLTARVVDSSVIVDLPDDLGEGAYALAYRIVSADGHPVGGALNFQIGEGDFAAVDSGTIGSDSSLVSTVVSVLSGTQYLGLLLLAGLLLFECVVARAQHPAHRRIRISARYAYGTALLASLLLIPATGSRVTGTLALLPVSSWSAGVSWNVVVSALLILVLGGSSLMIGTRTSPRRALAAAAAAGALAAPALVGHTQTVEPAWVMLSADLAHLLTGAFWVGGVCGLLLYLAASRPGDAGGEPRVPASTVLTTVSRFSQLALVSVVVLAISGVTMSVLTVGSWSALVGGTYGTLLIAKLAIVAVVIVVAGANRFSLLPHIARQPTEPQRWRRLRLALSIEAALLVAVILVTGFLTNTSPGAGMSGEHGDGTGTQSGHTMTVTADSQGLAVEGDLSPGTAGTNTLAFQLKYDGEPVEAQDVAVEVRLPAQDLGPFPATVTFDARTGTYDATLAMPTDGAWQIQISTRVDTFTQPIAVIPIDIARG